MRRRPALAALQPVMVFAWVRVAMTVVALIAIVALDFPFHGRAFAVIGGLGLPWTVGVLLVARRRPGIALHPLVAAGDFLILVLLEVVVPETYGAVRSAALFLVAVHAHFQGERRGLGVAALGSGVLVAATAIRGDQPEHGALLAFWETVFVLTALATGLLVGRLVSAALASRQQARRLSRHTIQSESELRRKVAEAIHDGPVQELIGLDMMLSAAAKAASDGDSPRAGALIHDARAITTRNVEMLRDEIVDLGPYAFEELGFATAVENCIAVWEQRYGLEVLMQIQELEMEPQMAGDLFRITQEAVVNAGRHADAERVSISLRRLGRDLELRIVDDGQGFGGTGPLGVIEPGHLGLASIQERAELMDGRLEIETSGRGTKVLVVAPLQPVG
jgi:signal transduction histidine kinase